MLLCIILENADGLMHGEVILNHVKRSATLKSQLLNSYFKNKMQTSFWPLAFLNS